MKQLIFSIVLITTASMAIAKDSLPAISHDGLHLLKDTKVRAVYMKPGADLSQYDQVAILKCYVAFAKNWKREHNEEAMFDQQVTDKDMQKIRDELSEEFTREFTRVLSTEGGHKVVSQGNSGVLILRPAIVNLEVTAPDIMTAGMSQTVVASAGSMTLYLELYDGKTGDIIARIIDPEAADDGMNEIANSVTNRAAADRILSRWARLLNNHLAEVKH